MGHTWREAQRAVGEREVAQMPRKGAGSALSISLPRAKLSSEYSLEEREGCDLKGPKKCIYLLIVAGPRF